MSIVAIGMNLMLAGLLIAALVMGLRLNGRLKALRDSHEGFAKAVADLDAAALRAEQGLADLRAATDEALDLLGERIEKARALSQKLERQLQPSPGRRAEPQDPGADAERVAHRLGSLLSAARETRPARTEPARPARREPARTEGDDELFERESREALRRERLKASVAGEAEDLVLDEREPLRMTRGTRR
jgi:hypothetical protein